MQRAARRSITRSSSSASRCRPRHSILQAQKQLGVALGESGYMRIKAGSNICGLATSPAYPTQVSAVTSPVPPWPPEPPGRPPAPPEPPPPGFLADRTAAAVAFCSAALAVLVALVALLLVLCGARPPTILYAICVSSAPANVARCLSGLGALIQVLQLPSHAIVRWAAQWQCPAGADASSNDSACGARGDALDLDERDAVGYRPRDALAMSCPDRIGIRGPPSPLSAPSFRRRPPTRDRDLLRLRPLLRHVGRALPEWASRACNATGAPHFDSWSTSPMASSRPVRAPRRETNCRWYSCAAHNCSRGSSASSRSS